MNPHRSRLPILSLLLALAACHEEPPVHGPLRQEAYVWQRDWSPAVREAVGQAKDFSSLVVLAAEVDLSQRAPRVVRVPLDAEALKGYGKPVGVAVRVLTFPGLFADKPEAVRFLQGLVRDVAAEARAKGIALAEIQIDYDCPAARLKDYRDLLASLKPAAAPVPLTFTVLPVWLNQKYTFQKLSEAADGYVLQVHSLEPPDDPGPGDIELTKPRAARYWVEEAAEFERPFRVALPTYSYQAAYDARGKLLGLLAEGPLVTFDPRVTIHTARSDPAAMADLIRGWNRARPRQLTGILWYRLPVAGDRNNWTWPTLRAVMAGRAPQAQVKAVARKPQPGLVEIDLVNEGEANSPLPATVQVRWKDDSFLAADGLAGFGLRREGAREIRLEWPGRPAGAALHPGERRMVAWLRFSAPTEVWIEPAAPSHGDRP